MKTNTQTLIMYTLYTCIREKCLSQDVHRTQRAIANERSARNRNVQFGSKMAMVAKFKQSPSTKTSKSDKSIALITVAVAVLSCLVLSIHVHRVHRADLFYTPLFEALLILLRKSRIFVLKINYYYNSDDHGLLVKRAPFVAFIQMC